MVGGDNGVFYTVGNHEEAVMTIEQRLECLERRAKRYRNALVLLVMSVCSVALIGATTDDGSTRAKGLYRSNDEGPSLISAGADGDVHGFWAIKSKMEKMVNGDRDNLEEQGCS